MISSASLPARSFLMTSLQSALLAVCLAVSSLAGAQTAPAAAAIAPESRFDISVNEAPARAFLKPGSFSTAAIKQAAW